MIICYSGDSADEVWLQALEALPGNTGAVHNPLDGGSVEIHHVGFSINNPRRRWVASRRPAINPAFALAELIWIMRGRRDARFLTFWNSRLSHFTGAEATLHGAYGHRLRHHFGLDQLERACLALSRNPASRQVVLQVLDPAIDMPDSDGRPVSKDIPCNVTSLIKVVHGRLEWLQVIRSNDLFLGLPYNLVQWTSLQEVLAGWLQIEVGTYNQVSDSLHIYARDMDKMTPEHTEIPPHGDIRLGRKQSDDVFTRLELLIDSIINSGGEVLRSHHCIPEDLPGPYKDWAVVLCAEAGRRLHLGNLPSKLMETCQSEDLKVLWRNWGERFALSRESMK